MPFIWYPSAYADKSVGISSGSERPRGGQSSKVMAEIRRLVALRQHPSLDPCINEPPEIPLSDQGIGAACYAANEPTGDWFARLDPVLWHC